RGHEVDQRRADRRVIPERQCCIGGDWRGGWRSLRPAGERGKAKSARGRAGPLEQDASSNPLLVHAGLLCRFIVNENVPGSAYPGTNCVAGGRECESAISRLAWDWPRC